MAGADFDEGGIKLRWPTAITVATIVAALGGLVATVHSDGERIARLERVVETLPGLERDIKEIRRCVTGELVCNPRTAAAGVPQR